ncbi:MULTISPECIES: acetate--CoA ligase family protein [Rhizobium]|uniref:Succinate--CoA ligase n=1 Tax=Rhizobium leguminosarum bv. viciae TaxID=387 RepID=A0A8G2MM37_RHILV|nr:acetate--CoA ligase [Rhizobium leguminosarum]NEI02814.1 succinate--CoA ligase [Rhizobium leguminosarum]NKK10838.1 succinate--CoA ligase [Rhizobium leguminosarum bv. viciae]NKK24304.1 succinate--CoA ligase [Rhizobium leguminosarum bv. viciae]TBX86640.1 succinate--CoA ligase [Rhizobium leguminosarum bv. viciae]TBZ11596.1 succinate--CoA ligase [Rhizobium leguminosarum bv. viciae]
MTDNYLDALYNPQHILIVGFSTNVKKEPITFLNVLKQQGYEGKISLLGRERGQYLGHEIYSDVSQLPAGIDLAFNMVSATATVDLLPRVAAQGVRAAVIFTSGFAEMGEEGYRLQASVVERCNANGMRIVGPNCPGYFNLPRGINLTGIADIPKGPVGLISQSGNVGITLWDQAAMLDIGFSAFIGVGNQSDIPIHEHIEYLAADENTKVIALYIEGLPTDQGERFISICKKASLRKPIVALKGGRTDGGMRAAQSHTAAMSSVSKVYSSVFADSGVIEVEHLEHLLPICEVLYRCPPMKGERVAIVGSGGGHSTVCTDEVELAGLEVPEFNQELQDALGKRLPAYAPKRNPVDMTGGFTKDPSLFAQLTQLVLDKDATFDGFINYGLYGLWHDGELDPASPHTYESAAPILGDIQSKNDLPIIFYTPYAYQKHSVFTALREAGIPCYPNLNLAALGLAALSQRHKFLSKPAIADEQPPAATDFPRIDKGSSTEDMITEALRGYGIKFPQTILCPTAEDAAVAAEKIGFPVVLKAVLPGVLHKSDVGGVATGLGSMGATRNAANVMTSSIAEKLGADSQQGFLVSQDLGRRRELFIGVRRDDLLGSVGLLGFGGVYAEALHDTEICLLPASAERVMSSLSRLRSKTMWSAFRGDPAVSPEKIAGILNNLNAALRQNAEVGAIECNPVIAVGSELFAVDAAVEFVEEM